MFNGNIAKWGLVVVAVLLAATMLVGGNLVWSYWQGLQGMVRSGLRDATSIRFDLARLDQTIEALTPVLQANRKTAAELDVEIEFLEADTQKIQQRQALAKDEMKELREALAKQGADHLTIDGKNYTRAEVEGDLLRRLQGYERTEKLLESRHTILSKRQEMLVEAAESIRQNEHEQRMLAQTADALNAELRLIEVAAATNGFVIQQPDLASARTLEAEIGKKIATLQRLTEKEHAESRIPVNFDRRTALERYDETFGNGKK